MRARSVGILAGLLLAMAAISSVYPPGGIDEHFRGRMLSECDGAIQSIVVQYGAGGEFTLETYRQFLRALPADVKVYALCPTEEDFDVLKRAVSPIEAGLRPIVCGHPITCWSRDRWIAIRGQRSDTGQTLLLCPRVEEAADVWPARAGDQRVASDLAAFLKSDVATVRLALDFDGGDFLADSETIFVTPAVARRNLGHGITDAATLKSMLRLRLGGEVVLLDESPQHHAGMFMASVGQRTMLVGDVRLGRDFVPKTSKRLLDLLPGGADFSDATERRFDCVAEQAAAAGYRVIRIPTICAADARTYLTYVNGIIDSRGGQKRVYMPIYEGAERMNAAAAQIWRDLGYAVTPIDCTGVFGHLGTLHCLVNVLERS